MGAISKGHHSKIIYILGAKTKICVLFIKCKDKSKLIYNISMLRNEIGTDCKVNKLASVDCCIKVLYGYTTCNLLTFEF